MTDQAPRARRGLLLAMATIGATLAAGPLRAQPAPQADPWPDLAAQVFENRAMRDGSGIVAIDAPYRAEDAAVVPITIRTTLPPNDTRRVRRITLLIDGNPSPVAAVITFGPHSVTHMVSTNVRVDSYTNLHVVAELDDGSLYVIKRFVKAAGGCSAPAAKQAADAIPLGTMRFRAFAPATAGALPEALLMIRHPNFSGMQMDQITRTYTPAHFVKSVRIWQGDEALLSIDSGISIAQNPEFRFDFAPSAGHIIRVEATDSEGASFGRTWPADVPRS